MSSQIRAINSRLCLTSTFYLYKFHKEHTHYLRRVQHELLSVVAVLCECMGGYGEVIKLALDTESCLYLTWCTCAKLDKIGPFKKYSVDGFYRLYMKMVTFIGYARESSLAICQSKRRVILCMWQVQIKFSAKLFQPSLIWDFSLLILRIHEIQMNFKSNWVEISLEICIKWVEYSQISSV